MDASGALELSTAVEEAIPGGFGKFPESIFLIASGDGRFAANRAMTVDGGCVDGLACFAEATEATMYMELPYGRQGEIVGKTFEEAREIAKAKQQLNCLLLFSNGKIIEIHWIQ